MLAQAWTNVARRPATTTLPIALPAALLEEVEQLGVDLGAVESILAKELELRDLDAKTNQQAKELLGEDPVVKSILPTVRQAEKLLATKPQPWFTDEARRFLERDLERARNYVRWVRELRALGMRFYRRATLGERRSRDNATRECGAQLVDLLRGRTGEPHVGLAAALLRSVNVIRTKCWQMNPTVSETQTAKIRCERRNRGGRACPLKPLRCSIATERLKKVVGDGEKIPLQSDS
jgi:hypothetical protein